MSARVFVAIDVGDAVRAEAARVIQVITDKIEAVKTPPKVTWVKPAALHVTLRFIGEVDEAALPALCQQLASPFDLAPFEVEWRGVGAFPSPRQPRALWLGVVAGGSQLGALEAEVSRRLAGTIDPESRPLLPHLTLGRIKMAGAGVDWPKLLQSVEVRGARSVVDRVTLYRSHLTHRGPHYTGLVSAPLVWTSFPPS
ncbi:MAG: RNA 2',3'-cyclic phosphodiesterase [Acidobacteriota bacterium]|nr:RNA 2',3'-cyclic phosphodiesterase [Acidobacteriota bacterium]